MAKSPMAFGSVVASRRTRPAELHVVLDPEPGAAARAREALEQFGRHLSERRFADLRVIVTELVTNSVKYGPGRPIRLSVSLDRSGLIRGDVRDGGGGGVRMRTPGPLGGGLGLVIVEALAEWGVVPGTSDVWFEFEERAD
jgi:anti-sigma regulatory factor (Ser/Thr protein kinase)